MICAKFGLNWTSGSGKLKTKNRNLSEMTSVQVYHRIEIEKPHTGITFTLSMCYQFANCFCIALDTSSVIQSIVLLGHKMCPQVRI